ncbi:MAG TPA: hypothetical protein VI341_13825 [Actinomycetota bacterium]
MSIPGRFHAETIAPFDVLPGQTVTIPLFDAGISTKEFALPTQDTDFDTEVSDVSLPSLVAQRPNRTVVDIVRLRDVGPDDDDRTGRSVRAISPPTHSHGPNKTVAGTTVAGAMSAGASGTSTWADTFHKEEFVNETDGPFCLRIAHNGSGKITVGKVVFRANNDDAKDIYRKGGYNLMSDGSVSRLPVIV